MFLAFLQVRTGPNSPHNWNPKKQCPNALALKRIQFSFFRVHQGVGRDELCQRVHIFWVLPLEKKKQKAQVIHSSQNLLHATRARMLPVGTGYASLWYPTEHTTKHHWCRERSRYHTIKKQAMKDKTPWSSSCKGKLTELSHIPPSR